MNRTFFLATATLTASVSLFAQNYQDRDYRRGDANREGGAYANSIPPGTSIPVRIDRTIDSRYPSDGRVYTGTVVDDVRTNDGRVAIPRGSRAELLVQNVGDRDVTVDLESVTANGRRYMVDANTYDASRRMNIGKNKRTAEYVGGGAVFGTLLGALAGGGKGAAIGALAGGAAGAGAQTLTRGHEVHLPAETVLNFRLEQPLSVAQGRWNLDAGYDRDGNHYHDNYYHRDDRR